MEKKLITNEVALVGKVVTKYTTGGATVLYINTGQKNGKYNYPRVVAFGKTKGFADRIEVGDVITVSGNLQANSKESQAQYPRTIAVSHIAKIEGEYNPRNRFSLYGRINNIRKINDELAVGTITVWTKVRNRIKVQFKASPEEIEKFCNLRSSSYIRFDGFVETDEFVDTDYKDSLIVTRYRFVKPPERNN